MGLGTIPVFIIHHLRTSFSQEAGLLWHGEGTSLGLGLGYAGLQLTHTQLQRLEDRGSCKPNSEQIINQKE